MIPKDAKLLLTYVHIEIRIKDAGTCKFNTIRGKALKSRILDYLGKSFMKFSDFLWKPNNPQVVD